MKVDLEKLRMGHSPLTDHVYVGTSIKNGVWRNKIDLTNDFIGCVIARWENKTESISAGGQTWEITVKKVNQ